MNFLHEIIEIRDKLKSELATVEKFLEIAQRAPTTNSPPVLDEVRKHYQKYRSPKATAIKFAIPLETLRSWIRRNGWRVKSFQ